MAIAITLQEYLQNHGVEYEVIDHRPTDSALQSSESAHIPGDRMAKSVLLGDEERYLLAVLPATHRLRLQEVSRVTGRHYQLITEDELSEAFADCEIGAIPPMGRPYGIETLIDSHLLQQPDIYFESGDHGKLIRLTGSAFRELENDAIIAEIGKHI